MPLRPLRASTALKCSPRPFCTLGLASARRPRLDAPRSGVLNSKRSFFGIGEILGVITNPGEVLRSLAESKKLLEEARQEMQENNEKKQIPVSHTFSPLPGFFPRPNEIQALERALGAVPSFTVLFGASSVGKTALCRQVLSSDQFHCIHFDLRLAGFADLPSLFFSLSSQMEGYFASLPEMIQGEEKFGWESFVKESYAFKHARLDVERRVADGGTVKTADIARLMELFQSALLKYWSFTPMTATARKAQEEALLAEKETGKKADSATSSYQDPTEATMRQGAVPTPSKKKEIDLLAARTLKEKEAEGGKAVKGQAVKSKEKGKEGQGEEEPTPPPKKVPVFFLDEAHKLPALIQAEDAMKTLLDSMLVLTKQDRLCHVIHATSDPFYMHWLRQMNVMQHANVLSIGDCSKAEARQFFDEVLLQHVPQKLRSRIHFEELYEVFGGKLAHLADYTSEFINSDGEVHPLSSSHFLQAHSLLNLQLIHSDPTHRSPGFEIYSSLSKASPHAAPSPFQSDDDEAGASDFSSHDLLTVMSRLAKPPTDRRGWTPRSPSTFGAKDPSPPSPSSSNTSSSPSSAAPAIPSSEELPVGHLQYFPLCRELGARAVDGMVRGRILELRWSRTVTPEGEEAEAARLKLRGAESRGVMGPVLVPTTPVVRRAMREVLEEYEEEGWTVDGDPRGGQPKEEKSGDRSESRA